MAKSGRRESAGPKPDIAKEARGRPSKYTDNIAERICEELAQGRTLRTICREDETLPDESTVRYWVLKNYGEEKDSKGNVVKEGFSPQYARAREIGYHSMADELLEIADDGTNDWVQRQEGESVGYSLSGEHVQRSRLRVDSRKWLLSKALPKIYGDKVTQEVRMTVSHEDALSELED